MTRPTFDGTDEASGRLREAAGRLSDHDPRREAFETEGRPVPHVSADELTVDPGVGAGDDGVNWR